VAATLTRQGTAIEVGSQAIDIADLQRIFDALPGNFLVVANDSDFTMVAVSQERLHATLTRREEVIGRPLFEVYCGGAVSPSGVAGANLLQASLAKAARTAQPHRLGSVSYPLRRPRLDGDSCENRHWNVLNVPVPDSTGRVRYIIHQAEDVTESLREQEATALRLRESDERLNAALMASGTGTFYRDLRSNRLDLDLPGQRLLGLEGQAAYLNDFLAKVHPDDRTGIVLQCARCARYGDDFEMQFRVVAADGGERWLSTRAAPLQTTAAGRPTWSAPASTSPSTNAPKGRCTGSTRRSNSASTPKSRPAPRPKPRCASRRKWRPWASSPAAWHMISTTCWPA